MRLACYTPELKFQNKHHTNSILDLQFETYRKEVDLLDFMDKHFYPRSLLK